MAPILIIDSSYYNFYRFFATVSWYRYSPERMEAAKGVDWIDNEIFMKTFEKMWFENLKKLCKKFLVPEDRVIFARDGSKVWRYNIYPEYKATRIDQSNAEHGGPGPVFKHVNENFHPRTKAHVLRCEEAEADDISAIIVNYLERIEPSQKVIIITSDHDYLQLCRENVEIYQLKGYKRLLADDPQAAMMKKILAGDPSDNIPPAWKKCGKKTAEKYCQDFDALEEMLEKKGREQYELNCTLIDFDYIPEEIVKKIEKMFQKVFKKF